VLTPYFQFNFSLHLDAGLGLFFFFFPFPSCPDEVSDSPLWPPIRAFFVAQSCGPSLFPPLPRAANFTLISLLMWHLFSFASNQSWGRGWSSTSLLKDGTFRLFSLFFFFFFPVRERNLFFFPPSPAAARLNSARSGLLFFFPFLMGSY